MKLLSIAPRGLCAVVYGTEEVTGQAAQPTAARRRARPIWSLPLIAAALVAVAIAFAVGVIGLAANPVRSVNADGTRTLQGTFEPYRCDASSCNGYVQAGGRSVFVQFPANCAAPARASDITVIARPAPDLGSGSYRATRCA